MLDLGIFTACKKNEYAWSDGLGYGGLFTKTITEANEPIFTVG